MLSRLARYLERGWKFHSLLSQVRDSRQNPDIPASAVFLSVFGMYAVRLGSFNGIEQQLRIPRRWDPWVGPLKPSADTLGYALERSDPEGPRAMLAAVAGLCKRKKVFRRLYPDAYWVGALDGIETQKSRNRCCDQCLVRKVKVKKWEGSEKVEVEVTEYYHRSVVLQLVGVVPAFPLDEEPLLPGETETTAGMRLLERFHSRMPRFLDVLTTDAFYLQAPFAKRALDLGYGLVMVLKQEDRDLYKDAEGLFPSAKSETVALVNGTAEVWDVKDLTTWSQLGRPVRVVRSLEKTLERKRVAKKWVEQEVERDWRWAVVFSGAQQPPGDLIRRWGHARWDEETRGFGELTQHWHLNHCYHHHPTAMLVCRLILFLAFILTTIFFTRNLKPALREGRTRLHLAQLLYDDLVRGGLESFWAQPP